MATGHHAEAKSQIEILSRKFPDSILVAGLTFYYHLLVGEGPQAIDALQRLTVLLPYAPRPYVMWRPYIGRKAMFLGRGECL